MSDLSDRFLNAINELDAVADGLTADEACDQFDAATLQVFWRDWTRISSWAGSLWRQLSEDIEHAASPPQDGEDVGGEGG